MIIFTATSALVIWKLEFVSRVNSSEDLAVSMTIASYVKSLFAIA